MKPEKITQMQQAGEVWWYSQHQMEVLQKRIAELEAQLASVQEPTPDNSASLLLHEIFSLCEHTENAPQVKPENEHQRGFDAGRRFEAKGIRRAIGDWFQSEFCGGSFMGEPAPAQQEPLGPVFEKILHENLWDLYENSDHPAPAQQPLTLREIAAAIGSFADQEINIARAIEAAHGIKEKP